MRSDLTDRKGFTLIELMVVVSVIAVLATLGGIRYTRYREYTGGVACNAYLQAIQNARIAHATDNNGRTSHLPKDLKLYMATIDAHKDDGNWFRCPVDAGAPYGFSGDGWDPNALPYCSFGNNNSASLKSKFPNFELHTLGGYRTFNDLPAGE